MALPNKLCRLKGRAILAVVVAFALVISGFPNIGTVQAAEAAERGVEANVGRDVGRGAERDVPLTAYELVMAIEESQAAYDEALEAAEAADAEVAANEKRIANLERDLPKQEKRSAEAARGLYKRQQNSGGLVELLLGAESFFGFLAELDYLNRIAEQELQEMARLSEMRVELAEVQKGLLAKQAEASVRAEEARAALEAAEEAQAEAERRAAQDAELAAQVEALAAELAEEPRANDEGTLENVPRGADADSGQAGGAGAGSGGSEATGGSGGAGGSGGSGGTASAPSAADNSDVAMWAARIDAYLAGSPLAGQGRTFAQAALDYGVDPRFSPAISCVESSKGLYCFRPHNAWGWGSSSWGSWEEAIDAHVRGLARGYGYTVSLEGAKKYCPPNWEFWYNKVVAQMNLI